MTKFIKENFRGDEMVTYAMADNTVRFVARFKRGGRADFLKFLMTNFTTEEYFAMIDRGLAPLSILEARGYISPLVRRVLKQTGYPQTIQGRQAYIEARMASRLPA